MPAGTIVVNTRQLRQLITARHGIKQVNLQDLNVALTDDDLIARTRLSETAICRQGHRA